MIIYGILAVIFVWLIILTWSHITTRNHYHHLVRRTSKHQIDEILDKLLEYDKNTALEVEMIKKELYEVVKQSRYHLQKVGLLRFNPFERIAGDQSFVLALLDQENNGVVINFIYTPSGIRAYAKSVKNGTGQGYELSEEEIKVIEKSATNRL